MNIPSKPERQTERSITEQATDWVVDLTEAGPAEHAAFAEWLSESPRHIEEYLLAASLYKALDNVDAAKQIDIQEALAQASFNVVSMKDTADNPRPSAAPGMGRENRAVATMRRVRRWSMAAAVAGCLLCGWWLLGNHGATYSTKVGELRSVELADGSVVDLNTQTRIEVRYSDTARNIRLLSGEALFKVAPHSGRPFTVQTDAAVIKALGTQFNVYRQSGATAVSVIEGMVQVSGGGKSAAADAPKQTSNAVSPKLTAGKGTRIHADGSIAPVALIDADKVTAWRQRRLIFVNDALVNIAAEFNRYNATPHLRVEGAYANARQLTAVFDSNDPHSLIQYLRRLDEFSIDVTDDEIVIRKRERL